MVPHYSKEVNFSPLEKAQLLSQLDLVVPSSPEEKLRCLRPGISSRTGVVSRDLSALADPVRLRACGWSKTLTRQENTHARLVWLFS